MNKNSIWVWSHENLLDLGIDGSINDAIEQLGLQKSSCYTIIPTFDDDLINAVVVKALTKQPILVFSNPIAGVPVARDVFHFLEQVDWKLEYSTINVYDILQEGIDEKSFDLAFIQEVCGIEAGEFGVFFSEVLNVLLFLENGVLVKFEPANGLNHWANHFKSINSEFIDSYFREAMFYRKNDRVAAIREVNLQANALANTPNSLKNPHIDLFKSEMGNINFVLLNAAFHGAELSIQAFKDINFGRFEEVQGNRGDGLVILRLNKVEYHFLNDMMLAKN